MTKDQWSSDQLGNCTSFLISVSKLCEAKQIKLNIKHKNPFLTEIKISLSLSLCSSKVPKTKISKWLKKISCILHFALFQPEADKNGVQKYSLSLHLVWMISDDFGLFPNFIIIMTRLRVREMTQPTHLQAPKNKIDVSKFMGCLIGKIIVGLKNSRLDF